MALTAAFQWKLESILLNLPSFEKAEVWADAEEPFEGSDVPDVLKGEAIQLVQFCQIVKHGGYLDAYLFPWVQPFVKVFIYNGSTLPLNIEEFVEKLTVCCSEYVAENTSDCARDIQIVRKIGILAFAILHLNIYLQANWTGPSIDSELRSFTQDASVATLSDSTHSSVHANRSTAQQLMDVSILGNPDTPLILDERTFVKSIVDSLNIDGEVVYHLAHGIGYLWGAIQLITFLASTMNNDTEENAQEVIRSSSLFSLFVWHSRIAFIWQRSLLKAQFNISPTLMSIALADYVFYLKKLTLLPENFRIQNKAYQTLRSEEFVYSNLLQDIDNPSFKRHFLDICDENDVTTRYSLPDIGIVTPNMQSAFILELSLRLAFFGYVDSFNITSELACGLIGFAFELTGKYGVRRKYQHEAIPQLVVKVDKTQSLSTTSAQTDHAVHIGQNNGAETDLHSISYHKEWRLKDADPDTDLLEHPQLSTHEDAEHVDSIEKPLDAYEQALLLARCTYLQSSNPSSSEMTLEELNALVQRCLVLPKEEDLPRLLPLDQKPMRSSNWLVFSSGLWFRCKAEHHRLKTVERACLQLQALIDQYNDTEPSASHRLCYIYYLDYPSRWEAQRELGMRMSSIGSFLSAFNMFRDLMMWEEAVECLIASGRRSQARELMEERLEVHATPSLWCSKGDLENSISCYETAWELSGGRYARAQRSIGHIMLKQNRTEYAIEAYEKALGINPLHMNCWFNLGFCYMKTENWDNALEAFARVVGLDNQQGEAWANMAGIHSQKQAWKEARICVEQAVKYARGSWKIWDSYIKISVRVRDVSAVIRGIQMLVEDLQQKKQLSFWVLDFLVELVLTDAPTSTEGQTGRYFLPHCLSLFSIISSHFVDSPKIWELYSALQIQAGNYEQAWEMQLSELRALQAKLFSFNVNPGELLKLMEMLDAAIQTFSKILSEGFSASRDTLEVVKKKEELKIQLKAVVKRVEHKFPGQFLDVCENMQRFIVEQLSS